MERAERAHLDWWANRHTNLAGDAVEVMITAPDGGGWNARATFPDQTADGAAGIALLVDLDPYFSLRFADDSTIDVMVSGPDEHGSYTLAEAGAVTAEARPFHLEVWNS